MEYKKFIELVRGGEKPNVDFKIECQTFSSREMKARAELARDICAMSNNGNVASYILVGVSDDGKNFKSVTNKNLTDDNIQAFCKKAIFPPPRVKLLRHCWTKAVAGHKGKIFVIIQVGPQARRCYRLNQDFIDYAEQVCYRRNEVWIRRGATSDLATPEEVKRLLEGLPPEAPQVVAENRVYAKLPRDKQFNVVFEDLAKCVEEAGGAIHPSGRESFFKEVEGKFFKRLRLRAVVPVGRVNCVWRCEILRNCTKESGVWVHSANKWTYEHGALLIVLGSVSSRAAENNVEISFKEDWGWFTYYASDSLSPMYPLRIPENSDKATFVALTLPKVSDTNTLHRKFHNMLGFLASDEDAHQRILEAQRSINSNLRRWIREGWLLHSRYRSDSKPKKLAEDEVLLKEDYGVRVLKRFREPLLGASASEILALSSRSREKKMRG